jgi:hypothetical protein
MGLLWTFMGYSTAYSFYAGMGELLGAFLLFARRTATLGALVVAAVMSNVVVLNFSYDVPVKLGSCHLLAAALFIAAPDAGRLVDFFVRNRPTAPGSLGPQVERTWLRRGGVALSVLVIGYALASEAWNARQAYVGRTAPAPYGSYSVETLTLDGKEVTSASSPHEAWQTILLATAYVRVWRADRSTLQVGTRGDLTRGPVSLFAVEGTVPMAERPATGELRLEPGPETRARLTGTVEGRAVDATIVRHDPGEFPLMQRGFHWISENPFNR